MSGNIDLTGTKLEREKQEAVSAFCSALMEAEDVNVRSVILYGSAARDDYRPGSSNINLLIAVEQINVSILKNVLDPVSKAHRYRISPFFITPVNLRNSADVFPIKFLSMKESYRLLSGEDLLADMEINREYLRLRCEQETKNLLLRLIRHYTMSGGLNLCQMITRTIIGFLENLRVAVSLVRDGLPSRDEAVEAAAEIFDLKVEVLKKALSLRDRENMPQHDESEQLYGDYMALVDKVAQKVDQMD